jgi:AmmeMemoRadiSam system protein B
MDARSRPALRAVESIVVPDKQHGRVLVLRDTQGITENHAAIPPQLVPIVARFTGRLTCEQIAGEVVREGEGEVPVEIVVRLAEELDRGLFLDGPIFRAARARVEGAFAASPTRAATHAGGAYHADRAALEKYIEGSCLAKARASNGHADGGRLVGLVAPHIDPWRGALGYGHAYGALAAGVPAEVDTFILFGTSHAPMARPFALCRKTFDTPLGPVEADGAALDAIAATATFDPYADQFNHKREHSLEFQVVFLKHMLKGRPFRIVPILAGLGAQQVSGADPDGEPAIHAFMDGVRAVFQARGRKAVVVAGADMAHVGPRFGDPAAYDAERRASLETADRASLERASSLDRAAFWTHVAGDLDERRVCGLAPIWSLLRTLTGSGAHGKTLHYEQTIDADDGSIVSHAAVAFYG